MEGLGFSLPISKRILSQFAEIKKFIQNQNLSEEPGYYLISKMVEDIESFIDQHLHKIEMDILELNRSLRLNEKIDLVKDLSSLEEKLSKTQSESLKVQLLKNKTLLEKRQSTRTKTESMLTQMVLKLTEMESQLEIFHATLIRGGYEQIPDDLLGCFNELQQELDSYYHECEQLEVGD